MILYGGKSYNNATDGVVKVLLSGSPLPTPPPWISRGSITYAENAMLRVRPGIGAAWGNLSPAQQDGAVLNYANVGRYNLPNNKGAMFSGTDGQIDPATGKPVQLLPSGQISSYAFIGLRHFEFFNIFRTDNATHTDGIWCHGTDVVAGHQPTRSLNVDIRNGFIHHLSGSAKPILIEGGKFGIIVIQNILFSDISNSCIINGSGDTLILDNVNGATWGVYGDWKLIVVKHCPNIKISGFAPFAGRIVFDDSYVVPTFDSYGQPVWVTPPATPQNPSGSVSGGVDADTFTPLPNPVTPAIPRPGAVPPPIPYPPAYRTTTPTPPDIKVPSTGSGGTFDYTPIPVIESLSNIPDGQIIVDLSGTRWRYYAITNQWVDVGKEVESGIVTYQTNGMASPDIQGVLNTLTGLVISQFKLDDNQNAYYYLLKPSGRMFLPSVEGNSVRLELNRAAATNLLMGSGCPGLTGVDGLRGQVGETGLPGPKEPVWTPKISGTTLTVTARVPTPLDTEISLRLYNGTEFIEIWYKDGESTVISTTRELVSYDLSIDGEDFSATVVSATPWGTGWTAKARQRGPKGPSGDDGISYIVINESALYGVVSTECVVSLRKAGDANMFYVRQGLSDLAVAHIRPYGGVQVDTCNVMVSTVQAASGTTNDKFVAAEPAIDSNKQLRRWEFSPKDYEVISLKLPEWIPDPSCINGVDYEWYEQFYHTADQVPVDFNRAPNLPERCCQEDFYFCPNLNTPDCGVIQSGDQPAWNWPPPAPPTGQEPNWEQYGKPPQWLPITIRTRWLPI